jgi:transketolase
MAHHGGVLPIGGTFFAFSDYMRGSLRLAALSESKVIFSFTHDSVGLGEDGPTHQPIEQLAAVRAMPNLRVIRPADANETATAWKAAVNCDGATALILSRQNLPVLEGTAGNDGVLKGAYVLREAGDGADEPVIVLIGTGSEVAVALEAAAILEGEGIPARVVSMPSWDLFELESVEYRHSVFPPGIPRVSVEAGSTFGWERWADSSVGINHFGASGAGPTVLEAFGIHPANVADHARRLVTT